MGKKYFCDECNKEVETEIKDVKDQKFTFGTIKVVVDIRQRICMECENEVHDEIIGNEALKIISDKANMIGSLLKQASRVRADTELIKERLERYDELNMTQEELLKTAEGIVANADRLVCMIKSKAEE